MPKYIKNWFSNMLAFEFPLDHEGIRYATPEHFYQAMKSPNQGARALIANAPNGRVAKKMGRSVDSYDNWDGLRMGVMRYVQWYRFQPGSTWYQRLMDTEGAIVEFNNWHDNFWGDCVCGKCKLKVGQNHLGKILMEIRGYYRINGQK